MILIKIVLTTGIYLINQFHKLHDIDHDVTTEGVLIDIASAGVPNVASDIVVFAKVRSGHTINERRDSFLNVYLNGANGHSQDEKQLLYRTYPQAAWSYNSENMLFPIRNDSKSIRAVLDGTFPTQNFAATVKIHGYYTASCKNKE